MALSLGSLLTSGLSSQSGGTREVIEVVPELSPEGKANLAATEARTTAVQVKIDKAEVELAALEAEAAAFEASEQALFNAQFDSTLGNQKSAKLGFRTFAGGVGRATRGIPGASALLRFAGPAAAFAAAHAAVSYVNDSYEKAKEVGVDKRPGGGPVVSGAGLAIGDAVAAGLVTLPSTVAKGFSYAAEILGFGDGDVTRGRISRNAEKSAEQVAGIFTDFYEHKQRQQRLKEANAKFLEFKAREREEAIAVSSQSDIYFKNAFDKNKAIIDSWHLPVEDYARAIKVLMAAVDFNRTESVHLSSGDWMYKVARQKAESGKGR